MSRPRQLAVLLPLSAVLASALSGCSSSAPSAWAPYAPAPASSPPPATSHDARTSAVIAFAEAQVGKRYCWGGTGPSCFDCSGLVQSAWRSGGVSLPRTSTAQGHVLPEVPPNQMRPGDILWWPTHVGLYIGNGEMIDAYHSGAGVVRRRAAMPARVLRVDG